MFWCVVGLYPDNLQEARGSDRERHINITDSSMIPAGASGSDLPIQESVELRGSALSGWMKGLSLHAPA